MFSYQSYLAITHLNLQLMSRSEMKTGNNVLFQQTANFFLKLATRMKILLLIICSGLISSGIAYKDYSQWKLSYFSIEMDSSAVGISQIFFDKGQGLQEQDSISLQVERPGFQKYLFPIPEFIKLIRFDPMGIASLVSIKNAGIENGAGDKLKVFPLHSFKAIQQIDRFDLQCFAELCLQTEMFLFDQSRSRSELEVRHDTCDRSHHRCVKLLEEFQPQREIAQQSIVRPRYRYIAEIATHPRLPENQTRTYLLWQSCRQSHLESRDIPWSKPSA